MNEDYVSDSEIETTSDESDVNLEPEPIRASTPKTAPPAAKKAYRPFLSARVPSANAVKGLSVRKKKKTVGSTDTPLGRPKSNGAVCSSSADVEVLSVLGELRSTLNSVVERLERTEHRIQSMEEKVESSMSSSASESRKKRVQKVPVIVRSETRKVYQTLIDEDSENFEGFRIGPDVTFRDATNQTVTVHLVKEVHALNPTFDAADIRVAAYTYYKTLCQEQSLQRRGISGQRKKQRRRRERISRKLQERQATFAKLSYSEKDKEKWSKVFQSSFMSSEESEDDDVIIVRPLPWRSDRVSTFLHSLDDKALDQKSAQAKRQMKSRQEGCSSLRVQPQFDNDGVTLNSWMFSRCNN